MENFKGTKGEWFIRNEYDENYKQDVSEIGVIDDNDCIITCWSYHVEDEFKANALLISKAPKMLSMLEKICNQIDNEHVSEFLIEIQNEAKQLIKEATEL